MTGGGPSPPELAAQKTEKLIIERLGDSVQFCGESVFVETPIAGTSTEAVHHQDVRRIF